MIMPQQPSAPCYAMPPLGDNPSTTREGTSPASFAQKGRVGTPWTFSSPDTPGMPAPSDKTAWDFLPEGWETWVEIVDGPKFGWTCGGKPVSKVQFVQADGSTRYVVYPKSFSPITQLEQSRLGIITPQMHRVAEREPHLTADASSRRSRRRADGHPRQHQSPEAQSRPDGHRPRQQNKNQRQHGRIARVVEHR